MALEFDDMYRIYYTYCDQPCFVDLPYFQLGEAIDNLNFDANVQCIRVVKLEY